MRERLARFWLLPFLVIVVMVVLSLMNVNPNIKLPAPDRIKDVRVLMWNLRQVDVMGQIIILLTGVFGVVVLFKERVKK